MSTDNKHIDIYELISKKLDGDISPSELVTLEELLVLPTNKKIYDDLESIWSADVSESINVNVDAAFNKVEQRFNNSSKTKIKSLNFWYAAAAVVVLVLVGTFFIQLQNSSSNQRPEIAIVEHNIIPISSQVVLAQAKNVLADSSIVELNKNSKLTYALNFGESSREVELKGEAFFNITPDAEKPFIIHTDEINIKVLGTSFFVNASEGSPVVEVIVKTGKVWLSSKSNAEQGKVLVAGEKARYNTDTKEFEDFELDENKLFWKTKKLRFRRIKMEQVAKDIEQLYNVTIVLDKKSKSLPLNSTFENKTIEEVLEIIKLTLDITYRIEDSTIYINAKANDK